MRFVHTQKMVRVGVDENLAQELLVGFPREAEIVRIPRHSSGVQDVDFWIIPFALKSALDDAIISRPFSKRWHSGFNFRRNSTSDFKKNESNRG